MEFPNHKRTFLTNPIFDNQYLQPQHRQLSK
eukprot:UN13288